MKKALFTTALLSLLLLAAVTLSARSAEVLDQITINPNPMDKYTVITLSFNSPASIGVNVETETGQIVKTLYWGPADNQISLTWNRIGDDGNYVPSGKYLVVVNHQGRYTSTKKTLILK